jgi:hypothetical protein
MRLFPRRHSLCLSRPDMSHGVRRFTQLRARQACVVYKKAVYAICEVGPLAGNLKKRAQLEESVAGPPGHIAEGFGRFNPADFAGSVRNSVCRA